MRRWSGLLVLVVVTGCGAGDSPRWISRRNPAPRRLRRPPRRPTPSTTASTATTVPTTEPDPACGNVFVGAGNPEQVDLEADVDGDGRDDAVSSFRSEGDEAGRAYVLQVSLAAGGGAATQIAAPADASVALLGGAPLDRTDGRDVLWVRVGSGAATTILGLFHLDGCDARSRDLRRRRTGRAPDRRNGPHGVRGGVQLLAGSGGGPRRARGHPHRRPGLRGHHDRVPMGRRRARPIASWRAHCVRDRGPRLGRAVPVRRPRAVGLTVRRS